MRERSRSRDVFAVRHQAVGPESEDTPPDAAFPETDSSEAASSVEGIAGGITYSCDAKEIPLAQEAWPQEP